MKKHNLYATAVHEAGHAVIGRVTGMLCGKATIMSDHDSAGHVITKDPWEILAHWEKHGKFRHDDSVYIGRILTYMAGREAQIELAGCSDEEIGDGNDRYQIALMFEKTSLQEWQEARLRQFARALVKRHRDKIERVAKALLEHKRLSGKKIDALVKPLRKRRRVPRISTALLADGSIIERRHWLR